MYSHKKNISILFLVSQIVVAYVVFHLIVILCMENCRYKWLMNVSVHGNYEQTDFLDLV